MIRNQLAKRLLDDQCASDDAEKSMIAKLKLKCGTQFTSKLEGMITDLSLASDQQMQFNDWCGTEKNSKCGGLDFSVTVLTTGYWPQYGQPEVTLSQEMSASVDTFSKYYNEKTQHRKLTWVHSLGTATIKAKLKGKQYDLSVNTSQALILLMFQNASEKKEETVQSVMNVVGVDSMSAK